MADRADNDRQVKRVLWTTLWLNLAVAAAKTGYGAWTVSLSLLADGFHSFFDGTSNVVCLAGLWIAARPPDVTHHYGHRKYEAFASLAISISLFVTCYHIFSNAAGRLIHPGASKITVTSWSYVIVLITMAVNTVVMRYERRKGRELKSGILLADSTHTQSDLFASLSVMISLAAAQMGFPGVDPVAAIVIAGLIGRAGYGILRESSNILSDHAVIDPEHIRRVALGVNGIREAHEIRTRGMQNHIYVDLRIHVPPDMKVEEAHTLAHDVEDKIRQSFSGVVDVVVHLEPDADSALEKK